MRLLQLILRPSFGDALTSGGITARVPFRGGKGVRFISSTHEMSLTLFSPEYMMLANGGPKPGYVLPIPTR